MNNNRNAGVAVPDGGQPCSYCQATGQGGDGIPCFVCLGTGRDLCVDHATGVPPSGVAVPAEGQQ